MIDLVEAGRRRAGRIIRLTLGWILTVAGLALGPVPILPGFVLLLPGLALLCAESRWLRRILRRYREQWVVRRAMREAERAGLRINLDAEGEGDGPAPPAS